MKGAAVEAETEREGRERTLLRVWGLEFRVQGLGFGVEGLG